MSLYTSLTGFLKTKYNLLIGRYKFNGSIKAKGSIFSQFGIELVPSWAQGMREKHEETFS